MHEQPGLRERMVVANNGGWARAVPSSADLQVRARMRTSAGRCRPIQRDAEKALSRALRVDAEEQQVESRRAMRSLTAS